LFEIRGCVFWQMIGNLPKCVSSCFISWIS